MVSDTINLSLVTQLIFPQGYIDMKTAMAILGCFLLSSAANAQPAPETDAGNFTSDPLFVEYVRGSFRFIHDIEIRVMSAFSSNMPAPMKAAVTDLPACEVEIHKAFSDEAMIGQLLDKIKGLSPEEREQFAGFARFLHTPDGARLIELNRQTTPFSDQPDVHGLPRLKSRKEMKTTEDQIRALLQRQPAPNQFPQAMFGLSIYIGGMQNDPERQAGFEKATEAALASPPCKAMQEQVDTYKKAHPILKK